MNTTQYLKAYRKIVDAHSRKPRTFGDIAKLEKEIASIPASPETVTAAMAIYTEAVNAWNALEALAVQLDPEAATRIRSMRAKIHDISGT